MDKARAAQIAGEHLAQLQNRTYAELCKLIDHAEAHEIESTPGHVWKVDIEAFWDHAPGGPLRVIVSVDDGGLSAWFPLTRDFLIRNTGEIVSDS